jgi:hypothetical protein
VCLSLTDKSGAVENVTSSHILFGASEFAVAAKGIYLREAFKIVGSFFSLPATPGEGDGGFKRDLYIKRTKMVRCYVGMAKCLRRENDIEMVDDGFVDWFSLLSA